MLLKLLFGAPNLGGNKIIQFLNLKNKHFFIFVPMFALSWLIYSEYFMKWFDFNLRFVPTFILGFLTCFITIKLLEIKKIKNKKIKLQF